MGLGESHMALDAATSRARAGTRAPALNPAGCGPHNRNRTTTTEETK